MHETLSDDRERFFAFGRDGAKYLLDLLDFDRRAAETSAESQMQEPKPLFVDVPRKKIRVDQELCNQTLRLFRTRLRSNWASAIRRAPSDGLGVRIGARYPPRQSPRSPARAKGRRELERSSHVEMHFAPREPFPPQSWARCSISRWRDWRAVGGRWSWRRCSTDFSGIDVTEFRVLDFIIDRLSHRGAKS